MRMRAFRHRGFTLVEIMIVTAIIGMLAAIAIPAFVRARETSQMNVCINNLRQIFGASQQWALEFRQAPGALVSFGEIQPYLKDTIVCPSGGPSATFGGSYTLSTVTNFPLCQIVPGTHILPPENSD